MTNTWVAFVHSPLHNCSLSSGQGEVFTAMALRQNFTFLQGQAMITAFAKGSTKELDIIEGYKHILTPLIGVELFSSNADEVREALTSHCLNGIQLALYLYIRSAIRNRVKDSVPEKGWSGPLVLQELVSYSVFHQACFSLVSPTLASVHGEYIYSRMKYIEVSHHFTTLLFAHLAFPSGLWGPLEYSTSLGDCSEEAPQAVSG